MDYKTNQVIVLNIGAIIYMLIYLKTGKTEYFIIANIWAIGGMLRWSMI